MDGEVYSGYFIELNPTEEKTLLDYLDRCKYAPGKEGIKEFLMDSCTGKTKAEIAPELETLAKAGLDVFGEMLIKKFGPNKGTK